jgi:AMP deaminase
MTLRGVFESMNLTAYDLTVDMLDVHAVSTSHAHSTERTTYLPKIINNYRTVLVKSYGMV